MTSTQEHEHAAAHDHNTDSHDHEHAASHDHSDGDCCGGHGHAEHDHGKQHADAKDEEEEKEAQELNWKVVSIIYSLGSGLCALFALLQYGFSSDQVKGFWLIFAIFPPALIYGLLQYSAQAKRQQLHAKAAKKD